MKEITIKAGEIIHNTGESTDSLEYIQSGKVRIETDGFSLTAKKGTIIGILEQANTPYSYNYVAEEDVILHSYPFTRFSDVNQIAEDKASECDTIISSTASLILSLSSKYTQQKKYADKFYNGIKKSYNRYKELCGIHGKEVQSFPFLETSQPFVPLKNMPDWVTDYYDQLELMPGNAKKAFYSTHPALITAALWDASSHAGLYSSLCHQVSEYMNTLFEDYFSSGKAELFDLYYNLLLKDKDNKDLISEVRDAINDLIDIWETIPSIDNEIIEKKKAMFNSILTMAGGNDGEDGDSSKYDLVKDSLDVILRYTNTDEAEDERIRSLISRFKILKDKNSSQDDVSQLRRDITKSFMDLYEAAIISSFEASKTPTILKMFFYFGYMDEELIGRDNAVLLYDMAEKMTFSEGSHVYTIYDWLKSIYYGKNEPSKNEFDQDYPAFLKSQKAGGYISEDMEARYLASNKEKLRFEIRNFFKSAVRVCTGRPSTFCPVLSDHNVIKPLATTIVTLDKITKNWTLIRSIDFSVFYRPCVFQSQEYRLSRESILLEVIPNVILMPTIGSKAQLWQETGDLRRDTPGRIAMPIFTDEDLFIMQLKLAGDFRWEMCKRIQGARWNDVTDHSLTSDYFDYLQFYKKNNDLSPDAKEKVKTQISNSRNSFKNVFIADYLNYIRYEALGSPRLNKVSKVLMFTYCPFAKPLRDKLKSNPMYENLISRHEIKAAKNLKTLSARYNKLKEEKGSLPPEIIDFIKYYTK